LQQHISITKENRNEQCDQWNVTTIEQSQFVLLQETPTLCIKQEATNPSITRRIVVSVHHQSIDAYHLQSYCTAQGLEGHVAVALQ
jgi:hypothetical protein